MEFDESRVYTALNADELKIGSKVIVSDALRFLKEKVKNNAKANTLKKIYCDDCAGRFGTEDDIAFYLAYLVEEPEELKWTDLKLLDKVVNKITGERCIVTAIDPSDENYPVAFGASWIDISDLSDWEKED